MIFAKSMLLNNFDKILLLLFDLIIISVFSLEKVRIYSIQHLLFNNCLAEETVSLLVLFGFFTGQFVEVLYVP
jgi:uncharacterized membrane protein (Fun14 family)